MSITRPMPAEDPQAERWRRWQIGYATSSQRAAIRARLAFTVLLTGTAIWLGLQLLSPSWL